MNRDEFVGKLQMVYVGDKRASKEIISEYDRLNNIIDELEKNIKNLYTYGIKNNAEQRDYLLNRLEGLKELKENNK